MIITLNNFTLNNTGSSANYTYLDEPISGLGLPPLRTSSGNYSGRDGGFVGAQFYSGRLISMTGRIFAPDVTTLDTIRAQLSAALSSGSVTMYVTTNAGKQYLLNCYLDSLDLPIQKAPLQQTFKISLIAADPYIYDNSTAGAMSTPLQLAVGGGVTWPISWTPVTWAPGAQPAVVNNTGQLTIFPVITLTGVMSSPTIKNVTTSQFFTISGLTTNPGDQVVIDMYNRTVLLNGGSILPYVTTSSTWWGLIAGNNSVNLTTNNSTDTVTGTISWRAAYRSL